MNFELRTLYFVACSMYSCCMAAYDGLKDALGDKFLIGVAINTQISNGWDATADSVISLHFNQAVAENCMKMEELQPKPDLWNWKPADRFIDFCRKRGITPTGHVLCWHSQSPQWMYKDEIDGEVCRDTLIQRLKTHIQTVARHFRGQVKGWDVVNEAIMDDGTLRQTEFCRIIGEDYIKMAFRWAHEADPDAELYYNDFSMTVPAKRERVIKLIRELKADGLRIDGVGMQSHIGIDYPELSEYEKSIEMFAAEGVKVMATELDMNILPWADGANHGANIDNNFGYEEKLNPYPDGLPADVAKRVSERWDSLFTIYKRHADVIDRVTLWGANDRYSWLNNWPVRGRTNYPLLFNRDWTPKPIVEWLISGAVPSAPAKGGKRTSSKKSNTKP